MMTSILLIDVQGLEARVGGGLSPADLLAELTHTMHGMSRQIMVQRAYCSSRISTYRRNVYRDAGYQIVETAGPDETLIMMTLDLADLSGGNAVYEEAILLGGTTDYTALARLAHENLMMISVMDHPTITASLEALADGLIDPDDLPVSNTPSILDRSDSKREEAPRKAHFVAPVPKGATLSPAAEPVEAKAEAEAEEKSSDAQAPKENVEASGTDSDYVNADGTGREATKSDDKDITDKDTGDAWPDPKTGPILIAGGSIADAVGLSTALDDPADHDGAKQETHASPEKAASETSNTGTTDPMEAELAEEIASELSMNLDDASQDDANNKAAARSGADIPDLKIEDLMIEEFTEKPAASSSTSPMSSAPMSPNPLSPSHLAPVAAAPLGTDDLATTNEPADDGDPLDALFADLGADLAPDLDPADAETTEETAPKAASGPPDPLDSLDIAPEDLLQDLDPLEPVTLDPEPETGGDVTASTNGSKQETAKASSQELSEEVDELLSRLMSDGSNGKSAEDVKLDVVPER